MDETRKFSVYDYVVLSFVLAASAFVGIFYVYRGKRKQTAENYLLGGRKLMVIPTAISAMATIFSANGMMGLPAEIYRYGTQVSLMFFDLPASMLIAAYGYIPVLYGSQVTSAFEYLEKRFSKGVRSTASTVFCLGSMVFMTVYIYAPSLALSHVTGIELWTSVASVAGVATFYTFLGGIKAVIWTDVFQAFIMILSALTILIKGVYREGGLNNVWKANAEGGRIEFFNMNLDPRDRYTFWSATVGYLVAYIGAFATSPLIVQRYVSVPSLNQAKMVIYVHIIPLALMMVLCILLGLVAFSRYRNCDPLSNGHIKKPDELIPLLAMDTLGTVHGFPGLFVAGLLSASLSSVSSMQNTLSSLVLEDFVKAYLLPNISDMWSTRLCRVMVLISGGVGLAGIWFGNLVGEGLFQISSIITGIVPTAIFGLFTLGMFFPWANVKGALAGYLSGIAFLCWAGFGTYIAKPHIPKLPVSLEGCPGNATVFQNPPPTYDNENVFGLYLLSFVWHGPIGVGIILAVGLAVSFITGPNSPSNVDPKLLSPFYHKVAKLLKLTDSQKSRRRNGGTSETLLDTGSPIIVNHNGGTDYLRLSKTAPAKS